jgi:hypothetical protein
VVCPKFDLHVLSAGGRADSLLARGSEGDVVIGADGMSVAFWRVGWVAGCGLWIVDCGLSLVDCLLWIVYCGLWVGGL